MPAIRKTDIFRKWMKKLKDTIGKAHINRRIDRLERGNPGDVEPSGGDKSTQQSDIETAKRLAREEEEEDDENE